jgi:UDP-N-acetylglucosamine 1-carboxyvinyltransferase
MLKINWPQSLSGTVVISGSKNAALPLIACGLFFDHFTLHNVPRIGDVLTFLSIIESLGVIVTLNEKGTLTLDTSHMSIRELDREKIKKIRVGIFLFPSLLRRFGWLEIPYPGGCNIGKRPIDEHLKAFSLYGYENMGEGENIAFQWGDHGKNITIRGNFAVTATENILMMAAFRPHRTTIELGAIEPHVICLIDFLRSLWVHIEITYDHHIIIDGIASIPDTAEWTVIADYIESGTFVVLGALTAEPSVRIEHARISDLTAFLGKCEDIGVRFSLDREKDIITVYNSRSSLRSTNLQTNIYPGFPTDLQSPFALLLTQADGMSRIHEVLFEGRLNWLIEIEKMKGHIAIMNPHEALIFGKTHLRGATVSSWDLRAWVTMILAGMIARGETTITNVEYIERGYEDIIGKIAKLGGIIEKA